MQCLFLISTVPVSLLSTAQKLCAHNRVCLCYTLLGVIHTVQKSEQSIWIHVTICALCMTLKNPALSSTTHSSSIVPVIGLLAAMPHGSSPWVQPYCICHLGFCHIWRQPQCQLGQPSCLCPSCQTANLSTYFTKSP